MSELQETDYNLIVTVRLYGGGTAGDAAQALRDYNATFDVPGGREVEIISVAQLPPLRGEQDG